MKNNKNSTKHANKKKSKPKRSLTQKQLKAKIRECKKSRAEHKNKEVTFIKEHEENKDEKKEENKEVKKEENKEVKKVETNLKFVSKKKDKENKKTINSVEKVQDKKEKVKEIKKENTNEEKKDDKKVNESKSSPKIDEKDDKAENKEKKFTKEEKAEYNAKIEEKKAIINDPSRTIFLQNVNYACTATEIHTFFEKFGKVEYCKLCKSNGVSKGTAFLMFKEKEVCDSVIDLHDKSAVSNYSNDKTKSAVNSTNINLLDSFGLNTNLPQNNSDFNQLNPFELKGKFLKIFRAYDKKDTNSIPDKTTDRRNREMMLYGLYNSFNGELNDIDKDKREFIMQSKKENFKNNPNLFTSKTRLTVRNFSRKATEETLKKALQTCIDNHVESIEDKEKANYYKKLKKIKQVKILRDPKNENKSKATAFAEICDEEIAKAIIQNLSNTPLEEDDDKGLIIDFALEDVRKLHKREKMLNNLKEKNEKVKADLYEQKRENSKYEKNKSHITNLDLNDNTDGANKNKKFEKIDSKKKIEKKDNANTIKDITNEKELIDIYFNTKSRGKKFRVKAKLQSLKSMEKNQIEDFLNIKRSEMNEKNKTLQQKNAEKAEKIKKHEEKNKPKQPKFDQYTEKVIDGNNTKNININKKSEQQSKGERKNKNKDKENEKDKKMLNKKREKKEDDDEEELGGMYLSLLEEKLK